ncbi:MAG: NAD(P)/FAD-dependent oxidoreductase [Chloroflexota bacterium]|nr:NAD(P)/FAD-dependent oxidoreductase [Chloroflexota bacterium]
MGVDGSGRQAEAPYVVIVGGGFGGLYAARAAAQYRVRITVLDRENHHLFQPLLYQVATAALSPGDIAEPIRSILRKYSNVRVRMGEATAVDLSRHQVLLADGSLLHYDYLILATGARHAYFGHAECESLAPGLKSVADALEIRRRILQAFEAAEWDRDPVARRAWLTFVIVGGGPTGVELAGAIAEISRHTLARDFRSMDPTHARVLLLEGGQRILPTYPPDLSDSARRALRALGVEVRTSARVTAVEAEAVHIGNEVIPTRTALWAAGVAASPLGKSLGVPLDKSGRVLVEPDLTVPGHPEVYVIGDLASFAHQTSKPLPGLAAVAIQQGPAAVRNIWRTVHGQPRGPFRYTDRGTMSTIGRAAAVVDLGPLHLSGLVAWLVWLAVHIALLIGFENRLLVLLQWAWWYFSYERGARLITRPWAAQQLADTWPTAAPTIRGGS